MADNFKFPDEQEAAGGEVAAGKGGKPDELEIELVDDTPEADRGRQPRTKPVDEPTEDELGKYSEDVKKRIGDLTHARHDERRRADALERERDELMRLTGQLAEREKALREQLKTGRTAINDATLSAAEKELAAAKAELKAAQDSFDSDAIVEAQTKLADATWKVNDAKKTKATPLQEPEDGVQTRQQVPAAAAPAQPQDPKLQRWLQKNQWFGADGNDEYTAFALGVHKKLINSGLDGRSDEYYAELDRRMKATFPDLVGESRETSSSTETPVKPPATVVAPATRASAGGKRKVQLTNTQVAVARKMGITPEAYARELLKMEQQS